MSDETKAALDVAVAAHAAELTGGNMLTDWGLVMATTEIEDIGTGSTIYAFDANDGQPAHVSYGLLSYALHSAVWDETDD